MCQQNHIISLVPPELSLVNSKGASSAEIQIGWMPCTLRIQKLLPHSVTSVYLETLPNSIVDFFFMVVQEIVNKQVLTLSLFTTGLSE